MFWRHSKRSSTTTIPAPINVAPSQSFDGDDGKWSTFTISVGTPPQSFRVVPSTITSETWVVDPLGCTSSDPTDCQSQRGGQPFNGQAPKGFLTNQSSTWQEIGLYNLQAGQVLGYQDSALFGSDVVALNNGNGSQVKNGNVSFQGVGLSKQTVGTVASKDYFLGMLGLSTASSQFSSSAPPLSPLLTNLFADSLVPGLGYSYTAGASYGSNGSNNYGSLVLGGYDSTRFSSQTSIKIPFSGSNSNALTVGVQSIVATNTASGTASMTAGGGHTSLIDSSVSQLWLPPDVCDSFASAFGLVYDNNTDLYVLNDTQHSKLVSSNPSITFTLGQQSYSTGASVSIVLPYSAFDYSIAWPIYAAATYYFPIRRGNGTSQYRLGRTLLQEAHLIVDYGSSSFNISQAAFPSSDTDPDIIPIKTTSTSKSSSISAGAIAGVTIGAVLAVIAISSLIFLLIRRRRKRTSHPNLSELEAKEKPDIAFKVHEVGGEQVQEMPDSSLGFYKPNPERQELEATQAQVYEMEGDSTLASSGSRNLATREGASTPGTSNGHSTLPFSPASLYSDGSGRLGGNPSAGEPSPIFAPSPHTSEKSRSPI